MLFASSSVSTRGLKIFFRENGQDITRILVTPGRKYGNAVQRNYIKRVGKEIFRAQKSRLKSGYDVLFLFYPGSYTYDDRVNQVIKLLSKTPVFPVGNAKTPSV